MEARRGSLPREISRTAILLFGGGGPAVWTPDGKCLLFSANLRPDFEYDLLNTEVYEVAVADGAVKQLTSRQGPDNSPAISPDGKTIAYVGFDDRYQGHQTVHLYLMDRDGGNPRVVTPKLDRDAQNPRWAPDGSGVYFLYDDQGDTKLAFYSLGGAVKELAGHIGGGGSSYGGGAPVSVAGDGRFAVAYNTPADPGDVAVGRFSDPKLKVVTALNRQLFLQRSPARWRSSGSNHRSTTERSKAGSSSRRTLTPPGSTP